MPARRLRPIVCLSILLGTALSAAVLGQEGNAARPSPWIVGNTSAKDGEIIYAWFDRGLVRPTGPAPSVIVGSPSPVSVWLRTAAETCEATELAGRRASDATDQRVLYVCARSRQRGELRLVAAAETPSLNVSGPITVGPRFTFGTTLTAVITTGLGFISGILTTLLTGWIQERRQVARDARAKRQLVHAALAQHLSSEILDHGQKLEAFLTAGANPPLLKTAAYNNADALGTMAWGYLDKGELADYGKQIAALYAAIREYNDAQRRWQDAQASDKAQRLEDARTQAERVRALLIGAK